jgi:hypothetical protein
MGSIDEFRLLSAEANELLKKGYSGLCTCNEFFARARQVATYGRNEHHAQVMPALAEEIKTLGTLLGFKVSQCDGLEGRVFVSIAWGTPQLHLGDRK